MFFSCILHDHAICDSSHHVPLDAWKTKEMEEIQFISYVMSRASKVSNRQSIYQINVTFDITVIPCSKELTSRPKYDANAVTYVWPTVTQTQAQIQGEVSLCLRVKRHYFAVMSSPSAGRWLVLKIHDPGSELGSSRMRQLKFKRFFFDES